MVPALRAIALLGVLLGTDMVAVGIIRNLPELAIAGVAMGVTRVALGLLLHRLDAGFKAR